MDKGNCQVGDVTSEKQTVDGGSASEGMGQETGESGKSNVSAANRREKFKKVVSNDTFFKEGQIFMKQIFFNVHLNI